MTTTSYTSTSQAHSDPSADLAGHWLGWAVFLAMSWTWCIGMFLPHLLIRDYGALGWIVFAVPNVLGAAAMGWTLRSADASRALATTHVHACTVFSIVTIAFHLFFAVAVIAPLARSLNLGFGSVLVGGIGFYILLTRGFVRADLVLAAAVLAVSLAMLGLTVQQLPMSTSSLPSRLISSHRPLEDLVWLAPVCIFGFLFCPYLDLTFHRARQRTDGPRRAFGVGFGVVFLVMIVFTALYSDVFHGPIPPLLGVALFVHLATQSAFTVAVHAREIRAAGWYAPALTIALSLLAIGAHWLIQKGDVIDGMEPGELIYRVFMGFYGLVAPAYVWLVVCVGRQPDPPPARRHLRVFIGAVVVAAPFFWLGFVARHMVWLAPGIAIVLAARLLIHPPRYANRAGF